ncbi:hypothetical protein J2847_005933 [Azospirillum agricola]|uniref:hypothetical protein n=1 Tax=Azospirillum agricola TaxID=1720247 RepID=UPI001AE44694|nr:hypothetical protein [Azospirillum agricola]MBP2232602.1 hypothetical protein [Azospirillum agricola]
MTRDSHRRAENLYDLARRAATPVTASAGPDGGTAAAPLPPVPLPPVPPSMTEWLSRLVLLYGLPVEYLVPDARLLPRESLRFFYLDPNWQRRLVDGAVSVAVSSSQDAIQVLTTFERSVESALGAMAGVRPALRGKPAAEERPDTGHGGSADIAVAPVTGFLLRSVAVSGWPGIEVSGYDTTEPKATSVPLPILRLERLSDDVLLCLFSGLPKRVDFLQPPEGLHFGVRRDAAVPSCVKTFLRGLGHGRYTAGVQIPGAEAPVSLRVGTRASGVMRVDATARAARERLIALGALSAGDSFTAAEFAVQMVRPAGLQSFAWGVAPATGTGTADEDGATR